jgi:hypothetical protein
VSDRFHLELLRLLVQVAWTDATLTRPERETILELGRSWGVSAEELEALRALLDRGTRLPEPDLSLLRARSDEVLQAARTLAGMDGRLQKQEAALLDQIRAALRSPGGG